ncbi:hypothetical protein [Methylosinus sp. sav-2]|uniref:hypothetical protein n=1 Tax=Methylosinus sp. sav-2 TaxID=2485168 RepID=UPI001FE05945|nr:hypothetical protein [Methylosinus sp. sav-2]
MRLNQLFSDREAEACPRRGVGFTPEWLENRASILLFHAIAVVHNPDRRIVKNSEYHRSSFGLGPQRIIGEIDDHGFERGATAPHDNARIRRLQHGLALRSHREQGRVGDCRTRQSGEIDRLIEARPSPAEPRSHEQLLDDITNATMIAPQIGLEARLLGRIETRAEDGHRRAKFMRRIGGESAMPLDTGVETRKRAIHGLDQRPNLRGHASERQSPMQRVHVDASRLGGDDAQ